MQTRLGCHWVVTMTAKSSPDLHVLQHQKDVALLGVTAVELDNVVVKG